VLGYAAVAAALVASSVLALTVLTADDGPAAVPAASTFSADWGSIAAIDHAAISTASTARPWYSADRGSIGAIDGATAMAMGAPRPWYSTEHGSIAAIDLAAEAAQTTDP
jgi:hypothetical protein